MTRIRTRFAPSPTGFLHLGSARTALFNWAFARHNDGEFLVRIEDSDRQRSTAESEAALLDGLRWLGLEWQGEVVRQSERSARHAERLEQLLAGGRAYRCICTRDELEERKQAAIAGGQKWTYDGRCRDAGHGPDCGEHTLRLRLDPASRLEWDDGVFGELGQPAREIGDQIIRRSDGSALYNFAVVVDDIDMAITHVIRGADHQVNTAFQLAIYKALEADVPRLAHLPLIVNAQGKKLSKRREPVSIQHYRDEGILPEAMINWLARIGWSHGDQEIFAAEEIVALFELSAVGRSPGQADTAKLHWLNQHYLKQLPSEELVRALAPHLEACVGAPVEPGDELRAYCELLRERSQTLQEMAAQARWLFVPDMSLEYEAKAAKKHLTASAGAVLAELGRQLGSLDEWSEKSLESGFEGARAALGDVGMGKLAQPVRVALTGSAASPGIFETLAIAGRERTLRRLERAQAWIAEHRGA